MKFIPLLILFVASARAQFDYRDPVTCSVNSCGANVTTDFLTTLRINTSEPYWYNSTAGVDCEYTTSDGACNATCGDGYFERTVIITTHPTGDGAACPSNSLHACNERACTTGCTDNNFDNAGSYDISDITACTCRYGRGSNGTHCYNCSSTQYNDNHASAHDADCADRNCPVGQGTTQGTFFGVSITVCGDCADNEYSDSSSTGQCQPCPQTTCAGHLERTGCDKNNGEPVCACANDNVEVYSNAASVKCLDDDAYPNVVYVSVGNTASPYYSFTDISGDSVARLLPNTNYTFQRNNSATLHPFYIGVGVSDKDTYADVVDGGIIDSERIFVTTGDEGTSLAWKCTNHAFMQGSLSVSSLGTCNAQNKFFIPTRGCVDCQQCPANFKTALACTETTDTVCQRDVTIVDQDRRTRLNAAAVRAQTLVTRMKGRASNIEDVNQMLTNIRDKSATVVRGISNRRRIIGSDLHGLTGDSDLRKMIMAEARVSAETADFDANDVEVEMTKDDFKNTMTGLTAAKAHMDSRDVARVVMKLVKSKPDEEPTCEDADIHLENINLDEFVEILLLEEGDVSIKCFNQNLVSRVRLLHDDDDDGEDIFQTQCWEGNEWGPATNRTHDDSYTCTASGSYKHFILSDAGGVVTCEMNQYLNNGVCTDCNAPGSPGYLDEEHSLNPNGESLVPDGVTSNPGVCECVEVGQRVLMHDGTHKNIEHLVPGDVLRTPTGRTTVRSTRRGGRHLSEVHDVSCNGMTGSITGNHAYNCDGEWRLPQETHKPRALTGITEVVAVETDNYCEDRMILESGLHVETWDGRGIDEWRPHAYENGRRLRCTLKGSWRDRVLKRVDSKI